VQKDWSDLDKVATNLENLEYSEISLNMENLGILREFCATSEKNCKKQSIFSLSFKYLHKQLLTTQTGSLGSRGSSDPAQ